MTAIGSIVVPLLFLLGLAVVAAAVVYLGVKLRSGESIEFSFRLLLTIYFYLLTIAGFLVLLIGLSGLLNAGLSVALGRDFSYTSPPIVRTPPPPEGVPGGRVRSIEEQRLETDRQQEREFREGLLQGASMVLVGGFVWGLHALGRRKMEARGDRSNVLNRAYLLILLALSSLVGIVSLTSGAYETLRFYLVQPLSEFDYRQPPGQALSVAIVFVPAWAYYLLSLLRGLKQT